MARNRPQLDLKECIGTYEFGVVPRSLFASDGTVLLAYDKAKIFHHLEPFSNAQLVMHTPAMETSTSIVSLTTGHAHSSNGNIHEYCP